MKIPYLYIFVRLHNRVQETIHWEFYMSKTGYIFFTLVCLMLTSCLGQKKEINYTYNIPQLEQVENTSFMLGEADQLSLYVWRHEDLRRDIIIDPTGNIYVPLAGEITAAGKTIPELENAVSERLAKYIKNPKVDINITSIGSRKIHVFGEVTTPGTMMLNQQTIALDAISRSGGFTDDGDKNRVLLIRQVSEDLIQVMTLNLDFTSATEKRPISYNVVLQNHDIIYVPPTEIADWERIMIRFENILAPILSLERIVSIWPNVKAALEGNDTGNVQVISN